MMRRGSLASSSSRQAVNEKQRRDRMKDLYSTLATLLQLKPHERTSMPEMLDQAANALKLLKEKVERLKGRKEELEKEVDDDEVGKGRKPLMVQVREVDLILEANLIMMVNHKKVMPFEVLKIIEEGGAQIMSSSFTTHGNHIYCIIYAQAFQQRIGFDAELIKSCLMELVC
uniref:uncharacterized protein LOC122585618 isoform X2 n=1 Tax=Erigeron canadensis TaxID=72917 RepID=UPI001CB9323C|nr:uncharacterized protein LOC122585618 isoform X2 [Erigeron canadensis]